MSILYVLFFTIVFCQQQADYDVVVYGSTPAGIAAAVASGRLGLKVALFEPLKMIGGMGAAGNLALHDGGAISGLGTEFMLRAGKYYNLTSGVLQPESFVSVKVYNDMLASANVSHVRLDCRLTGATREVAGASSKVGSISVVCEKSPVTANVFIDASYDGEIMLAVGDVAYTAGRESIRTYNETLAGARKPSLDGTSAPFHVNALKDDGTLLKYVANLSSLPPAGEADDALMAFQHRMCISGAEDRVPWPKPDGYNPDDFLLMQRSLEVGGLVFSKMPPNAMKGPGAKRQKYTLCCGISVAASDQPMLNQGWANATWERKQEIIADHTYFELGSLYYLANDPKVPESTRDLFSKYGLCRDEFPEFGHIPPQLYIRISNRMVSDYVMTQNNIINPRHKDDSIAVGDWSFDEHMTGKYAVPVGGGKYEIQLEGNFWPKCGWYDVPYKIMVPKRGTGTNLLVPVAFSASAVAYSSARIEGMFMSTGTAAGVAAKQLVDAEVTAVQEVNVTKVQLILKETFQQAIHGDPVPSTAPEYYNVTHGGISSWNGHYKKSLSPDSSSLSYVSASNSSHSLYPYLGVWRLAINGKEIFYEAGTASSLPPLSGWLVVDGLAPAPSLVSGPTS